MGSIQIVDQNDLSFCSTGSERVENKRDGVGTLVKSFLELNRREKKRKKKKSHIFYKSLVPDPSSNKD